MTRAQTSEATARRTLPPAQFDGVCFEARDAAAVAAFWGVVLGAAVRYQGGGRYRIDPAAGRPGREIVRVTGVREVSPAGGRAHLDVRLRGGGPEHLLTAGAHLVRAPGIDPWFVLADPEGNEFCAYPAADARPPGIFEFVVKCRDPRAQARWWADVLGGEVSFEGPAAVVSAAPEFPWDYMVFDPVPEPKRDRNRLQWHVDLRDADPFALTAVGATVLRKPESGDHRWLLADPEGNEFCAATGAG